MPPKYIFVSGGVISGLGKGVTAASIGLLLQSYGYRITSVKCENYINIDAGLINPIEHGDPFLCEDGTETDMDMGTYEKFLNKDVGKHNFITMGQIYQEVIKKERNFEYKGEDVEAIPHVCEEIIRRIKTAAEIERADIVIVELGGTAGEYQNALYYEASRIMKLVNKDTVLHIHVSYLPTPRHLGEPKTKPTQLSVKYLNSMGIQPDFIVCRGEKLLDERRKERLAMFCNVNKEDVINNPDVDSVYELPLLFQKEKLDIKILQKLNLKIVKSDMTDWTLMVKNARTPLKKIEIAIVGKYFSTGDYELKDSYAALFDALDHAGINLKTKVETRWVNAEKLNANNIYETLSKVQGIIVPIGWGGRGVEGMVSAIKYARENKIPYLGLCYGMQLAVVEYARNVLNLNRANTTEADPNTPDPVIYTNPVQNEMIKNRAYGGTMRLGKWECRVAKGTLTYDIYKEAGWLSQNDTVFERHRHRYEFNNAYAEKLSAAGLIIAGRSVVENLVEVIELPKSVHPFFIGTQYHPEYKSRPLKPHPLFIGFINSAISYKI